MKYGYARCSTSEELQDIDRQRRELEAAGAQEIVCEYVHGDSKSKPQQAALMDKLQPGDTIIVSEVSRLARSTKQLCDLIEAVKEKHLRLEVIGSITIDCTSGKLDPMSAAFLQMAGVFSELELQITRERVKSGMENARAKGKQIGRPRKDAGNVPQNFVRHYALHKRGELTMTELARVCGISRTTAYHYANLLEGKE